MSTDELTVQQQLWELACFFATHAPAVSPANMRLALDMGRTTGLCPPGAALDADDWLKLKHDLETYYGGSFAVVQEMGPGQLFIYDVFDRIDCVVGAMRVDGTLCVAEIAEAISKDEPLRIALGLSGLNRGELTMRCKSIFQGLEQKGKSDGTFDVQEFGEFLREKFRPAAVQEADPTQTTMAEPGPMRKIIDSLQSLQSPLSPERVLCPGRAHTQAQLVLTSGQGDPLGIQLEVITGFITVRSVSLNALVRSPLLEPGMVLLFTNLFDAVSMGTKANENLQKLLAACDNPPPKAAKLTFGFHQHRWEFRLDTQNDETRKKDFEMLAEWYHCLTSGASEDQFELRGGGFSWVPPKSSKKSKICGSKTGLSSSSRAHLRMTLSVASLACAYRTDKEGRSYILGRVRFKQPHGVETVLYSPLRPFLGRAVWEPTAHSAPPICGNASGATPCIGIEDIAAPTTSTAHTKKPMRATVKESCCGCSAPKSDITLPKDQKVNWRLGGVDGTDLYIGATPVDALIKDTKRSKHQPMPTDAISVGEALDLDTPGLKAFVKSVSQVDLRKYSLDIDSLPPKFYDMLEACEVDELLVELQGELEHEAALLEDARRVETFYRSPLTSKDFTLVRSAIDSGWLMEHGTDLDLETTDDDTIARMVLIGLLKDKRHICGHRKFLDIDALEKYDIPQLLDHVQIELQLDETFHAKVSLVAAYLKGDIDQMATRHAAFQSLCLDCAVPPSTVASGDRTQIARIILIHLFAIRRGVLGKTLDLSCDKPAMRNRLSTAAGWKTEGEVSMSHPDTTISTIEYSSSDSTGSFDVWLRASAGSRVSSLCDLNKLSITPADAQMLALWMRKPQVQARLRRVHLDNNRALCGPIFSPNGRVRTLEQDTNGFEMLLSNLPVHVEDLSLSGCCLGSAALGSLYRYLDQVGTVGGPEGVKQEFYNAREKRRLLSCLGDEHSHYETCLEKASSGERGYSLAFSTHNTYQLTNAVLQFPFYSQPGYSHQTDLKPAAPGDKFEALEERHVFAFDGQVLRISGASASELWIRVEHPETSSHVWLPTTHMQVPNKKVRVRCQLHRLDLSYNEGLVGLLDDSEHITTSISSGGVEKLHTGADYNSQGFQVFCRSFSSNSVLQELDLSYTGLGPVSLIALAEYAQHSNSCLRILRIRGNALSGAVHKRGGKVSVSDGSHVRTLDAQIDSDMSGIDAFFDALRPLRLDYLDIRDCGLGFASARRCALALPVSEVQSLLADDGLLLDIIALEPSILRQCPTKTRDDESFLRRAVSSNFRALQYIDEFVGNFGVTDRGLVQAACMTDGRALRFASPVLRKDKCLAALSVCTAGRSQPYRDDFAPPPQFFELFARKMQDDTRLRELTAGRQLTSAAREGSKETHEMRYQKILQEFKKHRVKTVKPARAFVSAKRLRTIAKELHITLTKEEQDTIISEAGDASRTHVYYDQQTPDAVYRARIAFFTKYATSKQHVERVLRAYHENSLETSRDLYDWIISHAKGNLELDIAELKQMSGEQERSAGLASAVDEVLSCLHEDLVRKLPGQAKPSGLRPSMQRCADKLVKILESGHKINPVTDLRGIEEELCCGEFDSRVAQVAKRGAQIWYADLDADRAHMDDIGSSLPAYRIIFSLFENRHKAPIIRRTSVEEFRKLVQAKQIAPTTRVYVSYVSPTVQSVGDVMRSWPMFREVGFEGLLLTA